MEVIRKDAEAGGARLLASPGLVTRSGQRAKAESGWECPFVAGYEFRGEGKEVNMDSVFVGTSLEVDGVLGADEVSIDSNFALTHSRGEPVFHRRTMAAPTGDRQLEFETVELDTISYTTAVSTVSGQPVFLGIVGTGGEGGRAIVAAVTATAAERMPPPPLPE